MTEESFGADPIGRCRPIAVLHNRFGRGEERHKPGIGATGRMREVRPDVPIFMITAYGDAETRRKAAERGAAGLFTKPIDFPELRIEIDRRIEAVVGPV